MAAGWLGPFLWLRRTQKKRVRDFEQQLPDAIDMKRINRDGPSPAPTAIPPALTAAQLSRSTTPIVDIRDTHTFAAGHLRNSINIPHNRSFLNWAGSLLPYDRDLYFIGNASEEDRAALAHELALIGIERIAGVYPADDVDKLNSNSDSLVTLPETTVEIAKANRTATILDVRGRSEFAEGHLPHALNIPVGELPRRLSEIPDGEIVVHCQGGTRSAIAASILQESGRDDIANMLGGFAEWQRMGFPVDTGNGAK